jgi:hypothetical protein
MQATPNEGGARRSSLCGVALILLWLAVPLAVVVTEKALAAAG